MYQRGSESGFDEDLAGFAPQLLQPQSGHILHFGPHFGELPHDLVEVFHFQRVTVAVGLCPDARRSTAFCQQTNLYEKNENLYNRQKWTRLLNKRK